MTEILQDLSRSPERTESEKLLRTIDNYVWGKTGVRDALLSPPFIKPSFLAEIAGAEGLWTLGMDKSGAVRLVMKDISYTLSKRADGYGVTLTRGKESVSYDVDSSESLQFLKALQVMLNTYASQIEQGNKAKDARQKLSDTFKKKSPKQ